MKYGERTCVDGSWLRLLSYLLLNELIVSLERLVD